MKFEISSDIINKTQCDKDFMCLKENSVEKICQIKKCLDSDYCLLKESKFGNCINRFSFGFSEICKCPTRIEIHNKYGI